MLREHSREATARASELVAAVKYLTWTDDNLLRQVVYEGLREDKPAVEVRRPVPHPKSGARSRTVTAKKPVARSRGGGDGHRWD